MGERILCVLGGILGEEEGEERTLLEGVLDMNLTPPPQDKKPSTYSIILPTPDSKSCLLLHRGQSWHPGPWAPH